MPFAHDTEAALTAAAAFVNTDRASGDLLSDPPALARFLDEQRFSGARDGTLEELDAVRALRPRLRAAWEAAQEPTDVDAVVTVVNELFTEAQALPQVVRHDDWDWHLHLTTPDAPLVDRIGTEAAMGLADLIRSGDLDRLKLCEADDCHDVLADLSRNRSRRFCDATCANRMHAAAYRQRQADRTS
ncbi:CGNR zinc finger domain-containing protein [Nitriliruptor alkaliphilus]|uniref:CGNR zinc finger domain-containing protein n=1 Tax=Nitriliruptor alkaliphilus TaxID=427918 RepID=UPI000698F7DA|nr:CGNR zinc finger domain-containing protein [Nitriliruptor alkaliphilus]